MSAQSHSLPRPETASEPARDVAVDLEDVTYSYPAASAMALRAVALRQSAGEMIGIMGASGAGKSTLAKCLNRIVPAFEGGRFRGSVRIAGAPTADRPVCEMASAVGMVFQDFEAQLFSTNVAHEVAFAMEQAGMGREEMTTRLWRALDAVGLAALAHRDPTSLSGGEKQRLAIAAVLALRPSIIVLDEPTTDLDPQGRAEVFELIGALRAQGLSLIVIEHEAEELRSCDRILVLGDGEIVAEAPPAELMARLDLLEQCGVHPPELNRVLAKLGIGSHARSIDEAEASIRRHFLKLADIPPGRDRAQPAPAADFPHAASRAGSEAGRPLVEVRSLSFSYSAGPPALDSIDLAIEPGEFLAIIGQNGSGKTTLAKQIVGLLRPGSGTIVLDGRDRATLRPAETAQQVGYVFQNPDHQIFAATVDDEVAFGPRNFGLAPDKVERRCAEVLGAVGLEHARRHDPFLLGKGERQRLAVASVLALKPRLLILDEPTTGLDYREQRRMMALICELNRSGIAVVMITHTPWLVAEYARRVVLMRRGRKLFDGPVREFFARDELLAGSSFRPPEVTALARRFGTVALTCDELVEWLRARL